MTEHARQIRLSMLEHLEALGFPEQLTHEQIINECPAMWEKLRSERLLLPSMRYDAFLGHALAAKEGREAVDQAEAVFSALRGAFEYAMGIVDG